MSEAWFYFFFGVSLTLYVAILFRKKESSPQPAASSSKDAVMKKSYLNLFFVDRTEFVHNIVRSKIPRSRPLIRALAKRAAAALLKDGIVGKVSQGLCGTLLERMEVLGIKCSVNVVYTQAAYAVIEINFHTVDLWTFFAYGGSKENADRIVNILNRFALPAMVEFAKRLLLNIVSTKLLASLPSTIREKLYNKMNTAIEVVACSEEEQGPFFVNMITQLNESNSKDKEDKSSTSAAATSVTHKDLSDDNSN